MINSIPVSVSAKTMVHKDTSDEHTTLLIKDLTENLDRINISCDQITFNPLEETVTITSCKLKSDQHITEPSTYQYIKPKANTNIEPCSTSEEDEQHYDLPNHTEIRDVICLGSIVMLILIWLTVFIYYEIFYEFTDSESPIIDNNIINKDSMSEDSENWLEN